MVEQEEGVGRGAVVNVEPQSQDGVMERNTLE